MPAEVIKLVHAMISLMHQSLHLLRRMFDRCSGREELGPPSCELDADAASAMIEDLLRSGRPAMVGRFGCTVRLFPGRAGVSGPFLRADAA